MSRSKTIFCGLVLALGLAAPVEVCAASWWPTGLAGTVGAWLKSNWQGVALGTGLFVLWTFGAYFLIKDLQKAREIALAENKLRQFNSLCLVCGGGDFQEALNLLVQGVPLSDGRAVTTPMSHACTFNRKEIVHLLIAWGAGFKNYQEYYPGLVGKSTDPWRILGTFHNNKKNFDEVVGAADKSILKKLSESAKEYQCTEAEKVIQAKLLDLQKQ